ncbi:MAG: TetR/AcrR family transcriptional regulator [Pseudomonadota bacterium]
MKTATCRLTLSQRKRLDILAAARAEFLEAGFRDTSMDRVAQRAEVSKRTVYNHFPSKEALFTAIASQFMEELRQAISVAYDPERLLEEQLQEIAKREITQITRPDYIGMFRVFLGEAGSFQSVFKEVLEESNAGLDPLENWIEAAHADGRLQVRSSGLAAMQFNSLMKGALFWPLIAGYGKPLSKREQGVILDEAIAMFLARYGCPG